MSRHFPGNLPHALSRFIGRGHEINEIKQLFSSTRLVSLTGPGGCGKTRLGLWVADELGPSFKDGVWLVELAPLTDTELVTQAVCTAVGMREQPSLPLIAALTDFLQSREMLLVLDNCEHLIAACAQLAETLLQAAPHLKILATSREALYIAGERVWPVPPLSVPEELPREDAIMDLSVLMKYEAPRLFIERALAVSPLFTLSEHNAGAIVKICRMLDGMPLAVELAAARVRSLPVEQIASRLASYDRFRLLTTGNRTAPHRHQTLEAMLDWSYALLSEPEQHTLRRVSIFASSWNLDAAEALCANINSDVRVARAPEGSDNQTLDVLSHLVDKSMVVMDRTEGEVRYHLLDTIKQYALDKLAESGELGLAQVSHLTYYVHWAEQAEPHLMNADQLGWLNRFEVEHDNIRAALKRLYPPAEPLAWSQSIENQAEQGLRLAIATARFWRLRAYLSEGRMRISAALALAGHCEQAPQRSHWRALALFRGASMAFLQSDYPVTRSMCAESLALLRPLGSSVMLLVAEVLSLLADVTAEEGNYATATVLLDEALTIWRDMHNARGQGHALMLLGWCAMRTGDFALAKSRLEESLAFSRMAGYATNTAFSLAGLAEVAVRQGRYESAKQLLDESLTLRREHGDKWGVGTTLGTLGWAALRQHDYQRMRTLLGESLTVRMEIGDKGGIAWCIEKCAEAIMQEARSAPHSHRTEDLQRAVTLFAAAVAVRAPMGSVIDPTDLDGYERMLADLRAVLGEAVFAIHWAAGSQMTIEQARDAALCEPQTPGNADLPLSAQELKQQFGGLTERERQVTALIAQGKTNRQIAETLVVTVKTAETYVTRILDKLGLASRVQIATWAVERGLAPRQDA